MHKTKLPGTCTIVLFQQLLICFTFVVVTKLEMLLSFDAHMFPFSLLTLTFLAKIMCQNLFPVQGTHYTEDVTCIHDHTVTISMQGDLGSECISHFGFHRPSLYLELIFLKSTKCFCIHYIVEQYLIRASFGYSLPAILHTCYT